MKVKLPVNRTLAHFGVRLSRIEKEPGVSPGNLYPLNVDTPSDIDVETRKLLNLVAYTATNKVSYNAEDFQGAYHTLRVAGREFKGQRDPGQRLQDVAFNFDDATVLDLGCNQGGMLLSIADRIRFGVGIDYDYKMINAANRIRSYDARSNLDFYVFDLEKENLELLGNFIPAKIDIVFLLSVCMWLKNWKSVVDAARALSRVLLFESNGSVEQQQEQEAYLRASYANIELVREASFDDATQKKRRLFLCKADAP